MPSHIWGDDWFEKYGNDLDDAISFIAKNLRRWGRIGVRAKEKYGTARINTYFVSNLHSLFYPGYIYCQFPKWLWTFDVYYGLQFLKYTGVYFIIYKWQRFVYVQVYKGAIKKWPHIKDELVCDASHIELLEEAGLCKVSDYWTTFK